MTTLGALRCVAVVTLRRARRGRAQLGSALQLGSVFGQNPIVGGRFYGLGNTSFALYGLAVLVVVAWVAASGRSRGRSSGLSAGLAASCSWWRSAVEALPTLGADFGGPPGLLLGGLLVIALGGRGPAHAGGGSLVAVVGAGAAGGARRRARLAATARRRARTWASSCSRWCRGRPGRSSGASSRRTSPTWASPPLLAIAMADRWCWPVVAWRTGWRPVAAGSAVLRGAAVMAVVAFLGQRLRARHPGLRRARAGAAARGRRTSRRDLHLRTGKEVART